MALEEYKQFAISCDFWEKHTRCCEGSNLPEAFDESVCMNDALDAGWVMTVSDKWYCPRHKDIKTTVVNGLVYEKPTET